MIQIKNWQLQNLQWWLDWLLTAPDWSYAITKWRRMKTDKQHRYYWWLMDLIEQETGIDKDTVHEKMKMAFLYVPPSWKSLAYCKSTTKLDTKEMTDYIENIRNYMAETIGLVLPDADQRENFINKDRDG